MEEPVCLGCNCLIKLCGHPVEFSTSQEIEKTFSVLHRHSELFPLEGLEDYEGTILKTIRVEKVGPHEQKETLISYRKVKEGDNLKELIRTVVIR